jgi:signal transduction histidine kinase
LRGQIDALGMRGKELLEQNKELQESLNRLNNSKVELEELQKQKDELFTMIIHDIKNPAALIKNLVQLLRSYDLTATEQQEVIDDIVETTARIVSLSQEVSRVLALEGSRMTLDLEEVPINEIVEDIVRTNSINAEMKSIELVKELADDLPGVQVDPQKIGEILDNLISNAIKFTQKGGRVKVSSSFDGENVQIDISDNGLGLSESDINNAFQRGSRLSAKPTGSESSTGLGLWIVKKLIEAHHGHVWVKSALGKGSTFSISLPLKQPV